MVTLLANEFVVPIVEAETYDITDLVTWTRRVLAGFNYIGMVEAALIEDYRVGGPDTTSLVHFHTHCLVWDFKQSDLDNRALKVNCDVEAFLPGVEVMNIVPVGRTNWRKRLRYLFKGQLTVHKLSQKRVWETSGTGIPVRTRIPRFKLYTHPMRPRDMVRMVRVMTRRTLDKLILAGGKRRQCTVHCHSARGAAEGAAQAPRGGGRAFPRSHRARGST